MTHHPTCPRHLSQQKVFLDSLQNGTTLPAPPAYTRIESIFNRPISPSEAASDMTFENEEEPAQSTIQLTIRTPVNLRGDNNLLAIDASLTASKIAVSVVTALKQVSMGGGGVPMIDEEGRPRPINVLVEAGTIVEGKGNVVGERAVLLATGLKRKVDEMVERKRAGSEPVEISSKRARK